MKVVVIGGGTGGCAFAGTLAARSRHEVVLVEAGPDYGPHSTTAWPAELLDSRGIPTTHDWGLVNEDAGSSRRYALERARVIGGCSSHNGCSAVRGLRSDYAGWARSLGDFWSPDALLEDFQAIDRALNVRTYASGEITPFQDDVYAAALATGFPASRDINDLDEGVAASICPVNKRGDTRWNAAFAFIDPVRGQGNFSIVDRCEVLDLLMSGNRVTGLRGRRDGRLIEIEADLIVLAGGAYGSPILLQRAGIGDAATLAAAEIPVRHHLPGVGRNLQDHPCAVLDYRAHPDLIARMMAHERAATAFEEGIIVKARSSRATSPVDLHIFSCGGRTGDDRQWFWQLWVGLMTEQSRGCILPERRDDALHFTIQHRHFSDPAGHDMAVICEGIEIARRIAAQEPLAAMLASETAPGADLDASALPDWIRQSYLHYWHPAGSCAMGTDPNQGAVTDAYGRVHGLKGLMIADASIMPVIPAANTNLPTAMLAHRLARHVDQMNG